MGNSATSGGGFDTVHTLLFLNHHRHSSPSQVPNRAGGGCHTLTDAIVYPCNIWSLITVEKQQNKL